MSDDARFQRPVGLLGLGLLGKALAGRLMAAGHTVHGWDIDLDARGAAEALGVIIQEDHHGLARTCDVVFLSLPNSDIRKELLWGEGRLAGSLSEGALLLDTTTGRPEDAEADAQRLAALQVDLVDVCVLASSAQVTAGNAALLVGDEEARAAGYAPLLDAFAHTVFYMGKVGDGCRMKLVANQAVGLHRLVLGETLALAERCGLDPKMALHVLRSGLAASAVMETKGQKMLDQEFSPVARLAQHAKDVDLILELGRACGARLPLSELHHDVLERLIALGHGGEDNSVVIQAFREDVL